MSAWLTPSGQHATAVLVYWARGSDDRILSRVHTYLSDEPHTDADAINDAIEWWEHDYLGDNDGELLLGAYVLAVNDPAN